MENLSKAWDWENSKEQIWFSPSEESYYLVDRWKKKEYKKFLDLGCGRGRHSILFAQEGFDVYSTDLSDFAIKGLNEWAYKEHLNIETIVSDMMNLPYKDSSFDCLLAFHVISHTDTTGIKLILSEIRRVLKDGGEFFITLCSKNTWSYQKAGYPKLDENTVMRTEDGPEKNVPHFYVDGSSIKELLSDFSLLTVRQVQEVIVDGSELDSWHYFILGHK